MFERPRIKYLKIRSKHYHRIKQGNRLFTIRIADWPINEYDLIVFYSAAFPDKYALVINISNSMYFPPFFIQSDVFKPKKDDKGEKGSNVFNFLMQLCNDKNLAQDVFNYHKDGDVLKHGFYMINFVLNNKVDEITMQGIKNVLGLKKTMGVVKK